MHRLMGHRDEIIHMLNEPIQARHQDDADAREAMIAHNDRVIAAAKAGGPAPADAARMLADEGTTAEMLEGAGVGGRKAEDGGRRGEVGGRRTEDGGQSAEDGSFEEML
jgi:hypothetical protein